MNENIHLISIDSCKRCIEQCGQGGVISKNLYRPIV